LYAGDISLNVCNKPYPSKNGFEENINKLHSHYLKKGNVMHGE
jgi:hypothetical protein